MAAPTPNRAPSPSPRPHPYAWTPPRIVREAALLVVVGAIQIGGTALAAGHQSAARDLGTAGVALLALGVVLLPFRYRFPTAVLAGTWASTLAYWSLDFPRGPVFASLLVAFVYAILVGRRRAAIVSLVVGFFAFNWLGAAVGEMDAPPWGAAAALGAWLIALFSASEVVRSRREHAREQARAREEAWQRRATDERLRIARDLHDLVAHNMSLINIQAGVALHLMDDDPAVARNALHTIKSSSKEALVELRSILGVLRQVDEGAPLAPTPGLARLPDLVANAAAAGVRVHLEVEGDVHAVPRNTDLAAFRIIQESLTNVARHSDRPDAFVRIRADDGELGLEVLDEGSGRRRASDLPAGGSGIPGMRERAAAVGGSLEAGPRPGRGFAVRARLPLAVAP
jgi:signal transduction histidine kinase